MGFGALSSLTSGVVIYIAIGSVSGDLLTTGSANIDIGNEGVAGDDHTIRIGGDIGAGPQTRAFIAGIRGVPISGGVPVGVNSSGQLGVKPSSARYKEAIQPMDKASEAILALKPVTFRYKKELDPKGTEQFGLVAEEVARVKPGLVVSDEQGKPFSVRYEEVNAMLLNEFLKEHRKVQELEANDAEQQKEIKVLMATVKEQAAQIRKVNDKVEMNRSTQQMVVNDR